MAEEDMQVVKLSDDFYKDGFGKVLLIIAGLCAAIAILFALYLYLYLQRPPPVTFSVDADWRVKPEVPIDQPYLSDAELLQWVSEVLPKSFDYDFNSYNNDLKNASVYFTQNGWKVFLDQLNIYVNYSKVQANKVFVEGTPAGAPVILNRGMYSGRYAWWIQMPINLNFFGLNPPADQVLTLQILVVRVSTLGNLDGVGIENVIVPNAA